MAPAVDFLRHLGVVQAHARRTRRPRWPPVRWCCCSPGGDVDVYRPTFEEDVISFGGRTGYVEAAVDRGGADRADGVDRGAGNAAVPEPRAGGWPVRSGSAGLERRLGRTDILPISFGFPFGVSVLVPVNMPLPAKIVTEVLDADRRARSSSASTPTCRRSTPTSAGVMQAALHRLARKRRFPILG